MLDIKFIREYPQIVKDAAQNKNIKVDVDKLLNLDSQIKTLNSQLESLQAERNTLASSLQKSKPTPEQIDQGKKIKEGIATLESDLTPLQTEFQSLMYQIPNIPLASVPVGKSEDENIVTEIIGQAPKFNFTPKSHAEIANAKGWLDKERAAKVSGARFAYIKGDMVQLQFALINYAISRLTDQNWLQSILQEAGLDLPATPFIPVLPPMMVKTEPFQKTARLNKAETTYQLEGEELWMNASAEHSICPMYMDEVIPQDQFPIRYLGYATSFRKEAGTYGKDTEGILRMHQFDKLEMEVFSSAESGYKEHQFLIAIQRKILDELGLHYHVLNKCTADIGTPNASGVDLETWFPSQSTFRETSSADYMTDFQARRLNSRIKTNAGLELMHTNDATCIVLSRIPPAIIENFQTENGDVRIPAVLQPFMGGRELI